MTIHHYRPWTMALHDHAFRALFDASPNPYLVLDRELTIVAANRVYLASTGRSLAEIAGRPAAEVFPADPVNMRHMLASFNRVLRSGRPDTLALQRYDIPRPEADGGGMATRYWTITHLPVLDAAGEVELVLQHPIDVTGLARMREAAGLSLDADAPLLAEQTGLIDRARHVQEANRHLEADVARLRTLFLKAPSFMAVLRGPEHVFEFVNEAMIELLGPRVYLGRPVREALVELADQRLFEVLDAVHASGKEYLAYDIPIRVRRGAGAALERRYINVIYQPIIEEGEIAGIFVEGTDVTEQHLARRTVEMQVVQMKQVERRQAFQLALADRLAPLDEVEEIIGAASALLGETLGLARVLFTEVAEASSLATVRRDWCRPGMPSVAGFVTTVEAFGAELAQELRRGNAAVVTDVEQDPRTRAVLPAYERFGIRAHVTLPLIKAGELRIALSMHSEPPRAWTEDEVWMAREMAERTWASVENAAAQAELRAERDRSRYIFDTMTEGFALLDADWTITRMNATGLQLVQLPEDAVIGRNHWEAFPASVGSEIERICRAVMATREAGQVEYPYPLPDGGHLWMEVRVYPAMDGGLAVFFRDITKRRRAQEQLRLEALRKDEFLAMLAHELRNPLAPIGAAAELLALGRLSEEGVRHTSAIVARQVGHMTSLINDLLDVSRVTRGLVALACDPVDVKTAVADALEQVRPLVQARHHRLELHLAPDEAVVEGDRKRLVQVLANLLNNAAKYTPDGGRIVVGLEVQDERVHLFVEDNGIGMTPEVQRGVFDLFTQAERTSDRSQGGLGIGLALVKSLVELHRGSVSVRSDGLGQGSRFSVCLPRMAAPAQLRDEGAQGAPRQVGAPAAAGCKVLVVDDNVDAAELLGMMLESAGHRVRIDHHSHAALEHARAELPDACILDIGLPDMDGNELARRLRALPGMGRALLVAVTGYGRPQDRDAALAAGFDHHLVKPVDIQQLLDLLAPSRASRLP